MKRIAWLVSLVGCLALMLGGLGGVAAAYEGTEVSHWEWDTEADPDVWVFYDKDQSMASALARCFRTGGDSGKCNKSPWNIDVYIEASVAQWVEWMMTGTDWHWYVLKPGKYAADCISFTVKSNQDVTVTFSGFADLEAQDPKAGTDTDTTIDIWYTTGDYSTSTLPVPGSAAWLTPEYLNETYTWTWDDSQDFHFNGKSDKLWCLIETNPCNSACEYRDDAVITLTLDCQKTWVTAGGGWG